MKIKVAGLTVETELYEFGKEQLLNYQLKEDSSVDFYINDYGIDGYHSKPRKMKFDEYRFLTSGTDFYKKALDYNCMMLHASGVVYENKAYLFSACSGTGKSTHTSQWLKLFGENAFIINDDKPAIRIVNNRALVYGTPWSGKTRLNVNTSAPLQAICFIERDTKNWIRRADYCDAVIRMFHGSLSNITPSQLAKLKQIIDFIVNNVPIFFMGCTPTVDAAKMAYEAMSEDY